MTDALVLFDDRPTTTADRLVRYGRVQAVERAASQELDRLKDEFDAEADTIEEATGGAYNVKLESGAQALRTQPKAKPYVRSETELVEWLEAEGHDDLVSTSTTVKPGDHAEAAAALADLELAVAANAVSKDAAQAVVDAFAVVHIDEPVNGVLDLLMDDDHGCVLGPHGLVTADGEKVPGTDVRQGDRHLRVTIPSDVKAHHDAELRHMFLLTAGDSDD